MMAFKKLVILLIILANGIVHCKGQAKQVDNAINRANPSAVHTFTGYGTTMPEEREYPIEGTPYSNDAYIKGRIYHHYGLQSTEMRYNIYDDRIEYKGKDSVLMIIGPDKLVRKVEIGDQTLVVDLLEVKGKQVLTYFVRLDSGKMTMLTKLTVSLKPPQFGKPIEGDIPAKYARMPDTHFYKIDNGPLVKIGNIKNLLEELPDHKNEMEAFVKKEKISANKPKELAQFSKYYNSLK
jgi:hypothetical protein